jgi:plasmid stability protein
MGVVLTIRDVPDEVKDALARDARARGQSLQAFLRGILTRQAEFSRNRQLLDEIEHDLSREGGADVDAPDAAELLDQARGEHRAKRSRSGRAGGAA